MSKLSPTGQSMAALFTPESEKLRKSQGDKAGSGQQSAGAIRIPGVQALKEGGKAQDSLGNPMSPGYDPLNLPKKEAAQATLVEKNNAKATQGFQPPALTAQFIRLGLGWEKILVAQKKLCEKAKNILTKLEGPSKYSGQRKANFLQSKSRGAILDLDLAEAQAKAEEERKKEEGRKAS